MEISGEKVLLIKKTNTVREYKKDAAEGFKGKKYRIYAVGAMGFAVHEDDDFNKDFEAGNIKTVALTETEEGLSLDTHVSWTRANAQKTNEVIFESITVNNFRPVMNVAPEVIISGVE